MEVADYQLDELEQADDGLFNHRVVRVKRDRHGYPDYLIEAEDDSGVEFRGWWYDGTSATDIVWHVQLMNGWGENVRGESLEVK